MQQSSSLISQLVVSEKQSSMPGSAKFSATNEEQIDTLHEIILSNERNGSNSSIADMAKQAS
jgi:hypothetical protein